MPTFDLPTTLSLSLSLSNNSLDSFVQRTSLFPSSRRKEFSNMKKEKKRKEKTRLRISEIRWKSKILFPLFSLEKKKMQWMRDERRESIESIGNRECFSSYDWAARLWSSLAGIENRLDAYNTSAKRCLMAGHRAGKKRTSRGWMEGVSIVSAHCCSNGTGRWVSLKDAFSHCGGLILRARNGPRIDSTNVSRPHIQRSPFRIGAPSRSKSDRKTVITIERADA